MSEESSEFDQQLQKVNEEIQNERRERFEEEQTKDLKEIREAEIEKCTDEIIKQINKVVGFEVYTREAIKEILKKYIE